MTAPLLQVEDLTVHFRIKTGLSKKSADVVHAVDDVSLAIARGETVALVGESGSGKTTVARAVLGLNAPTAGTIPFDGRDLTALKGERAPRGDARRAGRLPGPVLVAEPAHDRARHHRRAAARQLRASAGASSTTRIVALLEMVGLGTQHLWRRPHEFSGGQCQRIAIARALALEPELVDPRRADLGARRLGAGAHPRAARRAAGAARTGLPVHRPRPGGRRVGRRRRRRHVPGADRRDAARRRRCCTRRGTLHAALLASVPSPDPERRSELGLLTGDVPSAIEAAVGLPLPPALPLPHGRSATRSGPSRTTPAASASSPATCPTTSTSEPERHERPA